MQVRDVRNDERPWVRATLKERWGDEIVVGRGRVWTPHELPAVLAVDEHGERVGLATFVVEGSVAELVSIDALRPGAGIGRQLLDAVAATVSAAGAERLRVMTTNDNLAALRFYQWAGLRLTALRPGAVDAARAERQAVHSGHRERWHPAPGRDRPRARPRRPAQAARGRNRGRDARFAEPQRSLT